MLKEGGSLVTIAGHSAIIKIGNYVEESGLKYIHEVSLVHSGDSSKSHAYDIRVKQKPILWFVKGRSPSIHNIIEDVIFSTPPKKALHEWEQSPVEAEHFITGLTIGENQVVLDPFMGSGTTGIATLKLKHKFIGTEKELQTFEIAKARIGKFLASDNLEQPK